MHCSEYNSILCNDGVDEQRCDQQTMTVHNVMHSFQFNSSWIHICSSFGTWQKLLSCLPLLYAIVMFFSTGLDVDGYPMWSHFSNNQTSPRTRFPYIIHNETQTFVIRVGNWKLMLGVKNTSQGNGTAYTHTHSVPSHGPRYIAYEFAPGTLFAGCSDRHKRPSQRRYNAFSPCRVESYQIIRL